VLIFFRNLLSRPQGWAYSLSALWPQGLWLVSSPASRDSKMLVFIS